MPIFISRYIISGAITLMVFVSRALSKMQEKGIIDFDRGVLDFMINPVVVYALFLVAGLVVMYPLLRGIKALILAPLLAVIIGIFVYAYYIL